MKILIISYYAFPLNAVPSYRIESFCEGFTKEGADVTLLTRHWDESFKSWEDILSSKDSPPKVIRENGYRQIFLPYKGKPRSEEHTSELQSRPHLVCRLLLEKKKKKKITRGTI